MQTLSIIIPCYNEDKRLKVEKVIDFLKQQTDVILFAVNDGSTDNTGGLLKTIQADFPERVFIINNSNRKGKGESVRIALLESHRISKTLYHSFLDADLSVSLQELYSLFEILKRTEKKFIFGSRIKKIGSVIIRNEWRHFISRVIATFAGFITKLDVYDTQCSAKIFHSDLIPIITTDKFKTKWLFDIEIISRINKQYGSLNLHGIEEPLQNWSEVKGSKLRWFNFIKIIRELFILNKYYRAK
jgi:dolichyl-phosphate beta-glucosyltransferase